MSDHLFYQSAVQLPTVARAEGIYAWDTDGKRHIDACSGAIVAQLGHGHPAIRDAMLAQLDKVAFAYRTQFENQPAVDLAEKLVGLAGGRFDRVFFSSGGSESVESALKLARQYWVCSGAPERSVFIARQPSYHGSTMGALAMTSYTPLTQPFQPMIQLYPKVASPTQYRVPPGKSAEQHALDCADELDAAIREVGAERVAAFVAEPIGGASTGAEVPHDAYFARIREICSRHGILLILDEVMTGIGRTGRWFGFQHWDVEADILCVAKGLGAGYYPTSAIVTRAELTDPILASGGFQHGYTYAGNPLASATALAVIDVIEREGLVEHAAETGDYLRGLLDSLATRHDFIGDVRGRGFLLALEYVADRDTKTPFDPSLRFGEQVTRAAREQGVIVYPRKSLMGETGDHTLIAPPLITTRAQCDEIVEKLDLAFRTIGR
ncbi:aminotransferase [Burkholderia stabilis]|uniref:aminotransferase family protein n=1 Tax=Burkholderia stabilis TaxID=95485 RepID=UPI000851D3DD|nr:aspartate aminotransferase family protein [Burkholderia stabilis]AOR69849.1 aminotransferase [Burkholderia stabilis]HDR9494020.1 aspartate aminotransferase family protein [Burkholderia stabilis]HDR9525460.1 aspartate aminotransferase family protein [Burkholderia stabilis]HDR9531595.1 aspartate aminotransferase family protein [Burkholderia stabilis]HDR9541097.1 aspartate aminotransferase family protein [Burkholderia stabilis]